MIQGRINKVRVFDHARTAEEILADYEEARREWEAEEFIRLGQVESRPETRRITP